MFNLNYIFIFTYLIFTYLINFFWLNLRLFNNNNNMKAAEFNNIPYPILLNYWKKRISTALQIGNVSVISEAYRRLFNFGAETLQRDYDLERTFN